MAERITSIEQVNNILSQFINACKSGDLESVNKIISMVNIDLIQDIISIYNTSGNDIINIYNKSGNAIINTSYTYEIIEKHIDINLAKNLPLDATQKQIISLFNIDIFNQAFEIACIHGYLDIAKVAINLRPDIQITYGFRIACSEGHLDIVKLAIEFNPDESSYGFYDACSVGHLEIVKILLDKFPDLHNLDVFKLAFDCSYGNNRLEIVKLLLKTYSHLNPEQVYNFAFIEACSYGNLELVKWILEQFSGLLKCYNEAFINACHYGHIDVATFIYDRTSNISHNDIMPYICRDGHLTFAKSIFEKNPVIDDLSAFNEAFNAACDNEHIDTAKWLLQIAPIEADTKPLLNACINNKIHIVDFLIDHFKYYMHGFIKSLAFEEYSDEIKNILIDKDLVDPSELDLDNLIYYLERMNYVVPPNFINTYNLDVHNRGTHTKPPKV